VGLFSFLGKAVGKVAGTALGLIPGGGIAKQALKLGGGLVGHLLAHKQPMSSHGTKLSVAHSYGVPTLRAQPRPTFPGLGYGTPQVLRASPVMPGGGVATSAGIMAPGGGLPPASYAAKSGGGRKRKRKSTSARSSSRKRSGKKRGRGGRKLKFGSPAWRKKYMRKRR
jgi:hypothetical protein